MKKKSNFDANLGAARKFAQGDVLELRSQITALDQKSIDLILTRARSHYAWKNEPVSDEQIERMYDIVKMGSTSMNGCPARFVFVRSDEGRKKLAKSLKPANLPKVMGAPLTVIVAYDLDFWKKLIQENDCKFIRPQGNEILKNNTRIEGGCFW